MSDLVEQLSRSLAPRYRVDRELGRGGMAVVYRGTDLRHNRPVAIKIMSGDMVAAVGLERFRRETSLVAQLQHPHIVPLLDSGEVDGRSYFVMPLVEGESLRERLRRAAQLPRADVLEIARDVASALDYAHARRVVHRDIKPENILLAPGGAMVADFGIAMVPEGDDTERLTATGLVVGTPAYMSPEQATADRALDGRSDIYSLACVVYEALAGHAPFSGSSAREIIARHVSDEMPSLRSARPDLPTGMEDALRQALAKSPADRPQSATQLYQNLAGAERGSPGASRGRRAALGTLAVVLAVIVVLTFRARVASAEFAPRDWLLIASVDNRSGDSLLGDDLGGALAVSLEQSRFANLTSRQMVANALRAMGRADTTRLAEAVAREVAQRVNARAIVFPTIERDSAGLVVSLHVEATGSQRDLARESGTAPSRKDILVTLGQLADRVRGKLGERLRDEPPQTPLEFATTPSLEALRAWSEGQRHFSAGRYDAAVRAYGEALALDSNFARAHNSIAVTYYWINNRTRGDDHFDRALALFHRLTERERLTITADAANWRGRSAEAIDGYERLLDRYPDDQRTRGQLAYALIRASRLEDAVAQYTLVLRVDSTNFSARINMATALVNLGRLRDGLPHYAFAFATQPQAVTNSPNLTHEYAQTLADAGFPDSARRLLEPLAVGDALQRATRARALALIHVKSGLGDSALRHFREAAALSVEIGNPTTLIRNRLYVARTLVLMERAADALRELDRVEPLLQAPSIEPSWIAIAAEVAAAAGDRPRATRLATATERRADMGNAGDRNAAGRARAEALLMAGDAAGALSAAESAVAAEADVRALNVLARAHEKGGRLMEALERHRTVASRPPGGGEGVFSFVASLADAARLALALGDSASARRYAQQMLAQWPEDRGAFPLRASVAKLLLNHD